MSSYFERHEGSASTERDGEVNLTRVFRVFMGSASARPAAAITVVPITRYEAHPDYATALAISAASAPVSGELGVFDVTYTYSSKPFDTGTTVDPTSGGDAGPQPGGNDPLKIENPLMRTPEVSWGQGARMKAFVLDWSQPDRRPVKNSAGTMYEGQEVEDVTCPVTITFNQVATLDPVLKQLFYVNRVNAADFKIVPWHSPYPAGTLRCNSWSGDLVNEAGFGLYLKARVEFEFHPEGWVRRYLDQGYYFKDPTHGEHLTRVISSGTGSPLDPVKLDGSGHKLVPGSTPVPGANFEVYGAGTADVAVFCLFTPYKSVSFTNIYAS